MLDFWNITLKNKKYLKIVFSEQMQKPIKNPQYKPFYVKLKWKSNKPI